MGKPTLKKDCEGEIYFRFPLSVIEAGKCLPTDQLGHLMQCFLEYVFEDVLPEDPMMKCMVMLAAEVARLNSELEDVYG